MKSLIIGYGVQGQKRAKFIKKKDLIIFDPFYKFSDYKRFSDINFKDIKYGYVCTPEKNKFILVEKLVKKKINILVEKPFILKPSQVKKLKKLLKKNKNSLYVAYNHRFEPNIIKIKNLLNKKIIGRIYNTELYYGNGTAKLWKNKWRERKKDSIIDDLGVHLLDIFLFIFGFLPSKVKYTLRKKNELRCYDYCQFNSTDKFNTNFTVSLIDWKNYFRINIIGSKGSLHMDNLCKWGTSKLFIRRRKFPSGYPKEKIQSIKSKDPTWEKEENYFKNLCKKKLNNLFENSKINFGRNNIK